MQLTQPSTWPWWFWGLVILGIILAVPTGRFVLNVITRGKRLTYTDEDENGDVNDTIENLTANAASVSGKEVTFDDYSLARMFASEGETYDQNTKVAIGWVARNVAAQRGITVTDLLTKDVNAHGNGKYGKQAGRWASTMFDPYEGDLTIAQAVNAGQISDPTEGAIHYYEPTLQDKLYALGKVKSTADEIDEQWGGAGYNVPGVDSRLTFYKPV